VAGAGIDWIRRSTVGNDQPTLADEVVALTPSERLALIEEIERRLGPVT
jgi:hypothetical protein